MSQRSIVAPKSELPTSTEPDAPDELPLSVEPVEPESSAGSDVVGVAFLLVSSDVVTFSPSYV